MYKVFFNDRIVFLGTSFKKSLTDSNLLFYISDTEDIKFAWDSFLDSPSDINLFLISESLDALKEYFFERFKILIAAGGLVKNSENKLLCICRWGRWDLPKGKVEKEENIQDAALREVEEECGIHGLRLEKLNSITYHIYQNPRKPGEWILKPTYWYNMFYDGNEELVPQIKENITQVKWFRKEEFDEVDNNTWSSLKSLIKSCFNSE